ncbi:MAG: sigma-70 family RNA polymerase sigma factor [Verrucomicrobia bacterium]|nr:sigma-70 family RNA polymerase sigma factor [Verrucomicrobiota bacterium]
MLKASQSFISTRDSLLDRLKDWGDADSWKDFFDTYWKLIFSAALKSGLTETEAQEVVQETIIVVAKKMPTFQYDPPLGSFKGWLLQLTRSKIKDQLRKRRPNEAAHQRLSESETGTSPIDRISDPAGDPLASFWDDDWRKTILEAAIERVKRRANARHYQMFDLNVNKRWPPEKVAQTLRVPVGQVYLAKHKVSGLLKQEIKRLETKLV